MSEFINGEVANGNGDLWSESGTLQVGETHVTREQALKAFRFGWMNVEEPLVKVTRTNEARERQVARDTGWKPGQ